MISTGMPALDAVIVGIALLGGYLVGSIPPSWRTAREAEAGPAADGSGSPGPPGSWDAAGPGWGMLAFAGDLAKGVVPVAVGMVTWSWGIGWVAGLGALLGAYWPAFGRLGGGRGVTVPGGVLFMLAPPAGVISAAIGGLVLGTGALLGRSARLPAMATCAIAYPLLFTVVQPDLAQLGAVLILYVVVAMRWVTTRDR